MHLRGALLLVVAFLVILAGVVAVRFYRAEEREVSATDPLWAEAPAGEPEPPYQPTPVALNRGPEVGEGFRGQVHALLFGQTRLEVTARWSAVGDADKMLEPALDTWFANLQPAQRRQVYTEKEFSGLLPQTLGDVGQVWALDDEKVLAFLKQFHPRPSLRQVAVGRRAGPDGAFAILWAVSPSHLDVVFRIHAEFSMASEPTSVRAWFTPAAFTGSMLVNRRTGTVEHFRLALPTDKALNAHLTVSARGLGTNQPHAIVRVEHMDLTGGDGSRAEKISWTRALGRSEADRRLAKVFYRFLEIDWVPFDRVAARARREGRPIFAVVSWGALDDQSC